MVKADKIGCFLYKSMVDMYPDLVGIPVFPAIEQRIGVIWRKGKYQNAVTEKVIKYLKKLLIVMLINLFNNSLFLKADTLYCTPPL